jgi:Terminase large subunit, T4likevirus-type, N-terminal
MLSQKQDYSSNPLLNQAAMAAIERRRQAEAADPVLFAQRVGLIPDAWQCDLLRSKARQILVCAARQTGKSTACALMAAHCAIYKAGLVLLISPSMRQSNEIYKKTREFLRAADVEVIEESQLRLTLENGARVLCLPGTGETVRGFSPDLVVCDEGAFVQDDLMGAIRPMLVASGGRLVMISSPLGARGAFYTAWSEGGNDWERYRVPWTECTRLDREWIASERRQLGPYLFASEYECAFLSPIDSVFNFEDIARMVTRDVKPLFGGSKDNGTSSSHSDVRPVVTPLFHLRERFAQFSPLL